MHNNSHRGKNMVENDIKIRFELKYWKSDNGTYSNVEVDGEYRNMIIGRLVL